MSLVVSQKIKNELLYDSAVTLVSIFPVFSIVILAHLSSVLLYSQHLGN